MTTRSVADRRSLDSNILVYSVAGSGSKRTRSSEVVRQGGVISVQALNETAHVLRRKAGLTVSETTDALEIIRSALTVVPLSEQVHLRALQVAADTGYSIWDASIVAAALEADCDRLISEDMQHGRVIGSMVIENPFLEEG